MAVSVLVVDTVLVVGCSLVAVVVVVEATVVAVVEVPGPTVVDAVAGHLTLAPAAASSLKQYSSAVSPPCLEYTQPSTHTGWGLAGWDCASRNTPFRGAKGPPACWGECR